MRNIVVILLAIFKRRCRKPTIGLMASKPVINKKVDRLYSIPGAVPNPIDMPNYCYFRDRCQMCVEKCSGEYPVRTRRNLGEQIGVPARSHGAGGGRCSLAY